MYFWNNFKQICTHDCTKNFNLFFWRKYLKKQKILEHVLEKLIEHTFLGSKTPSRQKNAGRVVSSLKGFVFGVFTVFSCISSICLCLKTSGRVVSSLEAFFKKYVQQFFNFYFLIIFCHAKTTWKHRNKYRKHIRKTVQARNRPPGKIIGSYSWFVTIELCKQKQILEKTGNTRKIFEKHRKTHVGSKPPSGLRFTVLLELHPKTHFSPE